MDKENLAFQVCPEQNLNVEHIQDCSDIGQMLNLLEYFQIAKAPIHSEKHLSIE